MKKIIIAFCCCLIASLIPMSVGEITLNILYGVLGVIFSVGMSLIISFNGSNIKNQQLKKEIRDSLHNVRNNFLCLFCSGSLIFVIYSLFCENIKQISWCDKLTSTWSVSALVFLCYVIIASISNYVDLQKLFEDIEDKIENES